MEIIESITWWIAAPAMQMSAPSRGMPKGITTSPSGIAWSGKPTRKRARAYHDPCFLGKRNEIYEAPREILQAIKSLEIVEMKRTKQSSFCCGGGAGRVWTEEATPEKRPCVDRVKEALELNIDTIVVACPFCIENKIAVRDSGTLKGSLVIP